MTALTVSATPAASLPADCIVIGVAKCPKGPMLAPGAAAVTEAFDGTLAELLGTLGVTGAEGEAFKLPAPAGIEARLVLAVGLGDAADNNTGCDTEALRRAAGVATRVLAGVGTVALALPAGTVEAVEAVAVAVGGLLGAYAFTAYRTTDHAAAPVRELAILVNRDGRTDAEAAVRRAGVLGQELNWARDLVNTPANDLHPESFAAAVVTAGREHGLAVEVLDEEALAAGAFGGILGVGQGSARPPRLVRIAHTHPEAKVSLTPREPA
ncbi:hypothetical protein I0C86_24210 [Plantactinospora sp. S1510]|uniref:Probable cytosol aminopeptidase n=1 Tax=Plantactinospora alkalitolerans TaxID=2789879 RepID=A0ABS0H1N0_9ACTN|nr:M17 family peptidase N-terminal domain-containing protein [Plantactinospora alkalitolerans]MBF9132042.1 hypothetical protein [Plantactinospora alkalitolerans]